MLYPFVLRASLSENRFTLYGMRFDFTRILSENRFTLFGMRSNFPD
ncbi:hypothetical protein CEV31_2341 [Brucella thiophenivorans]|uniref:Uncharacterized protein n=1 Tax=Brucella thiophenivorans TaxID=571255 RepID=A0A256FX46_9HYPH|nr:hypothetical protein CEV31_2341 [Brucella thiophenivorans]